MPCTSFPITRALKSHIDPSVEPYTVLVPFRTDIWTHPKRDAIATPQRSPKTRVTNRAGDVDEAVKRVRSLMGSSAVPFYDNEKEEELGNGMDVEEKEEGVMGTCFGSCLGLRGGDTRAEEGGGGGNQYVVVGGGDSDGSGDKNEKAEDVEMLIEGNEDRGAERLRRVDRMSDLRGMNKRYDPDAESVYSQSTGTLIEVSSSSSLMSGAGGSYESCISHHVEGRGLRCWGFEAGHVWRNRIGATACLKPGYWYIPIRCGRCREKMSGGVIWVCTSQTCGIEVCSQCKNKWEK